MDLGDEVWNERLRAKLAPDAMTLALVRAGALLTGYELVKASILRDVEGFFIAGFDVNGRITSSAYQKQVLPFGKNKFEASLEWLVRQDALTSQQAGSLILIQGHRHEIAHELAFSLSM